MVIKLLKHVNQSNLIFFSNISKEKFHYVNDSIISPYCLNCKGQKCNTASMTERRLLGSGRSWSSLCWTKSLQESYRGSPKPWRDTSSPSVTCLPWLDTLPHSRPPRKTPKQEKVPFPPILNKAILGKDSVSLDWVTCLCWNSCWTE